MLNVRCLNWKNYLGRGDEYVEKLQAMCDRNLTIPFLFDEWTEHDVWLDGWWNKLCMLDEPASGWVLQLDLDVVITSNIDHLIHRAMVDSDRLWMRDDFSYSIVNPRRDLDDGMRATLGGAGCCNSSVMLYYQRVELGAYNEAMKTMHGDQNVLTSQLWPDLIGLLPNESIKSYKYHPGEVAPIVVFHGQPKPHEVSDAFVRDHWRC